MRGLRRVLALFAAVATLGGCYQWVARPGDVRSALQQAPPDQNTHVVLADRHEETLARPRIVGDMLVGLVVGGARDGEVRSIPLDSVVQVLERRRYVASAPADKGAEFHPVTLLFILLGMVAILLAASAAGWRLFSD